MMDRTWILSAFVDLRGFGTWIYRASIPKEVKEPFIRNYLEIVQKYVRMNPNVHFKYLGDGFLAIKEFSQKDRRSADACNFVKGLRCVTRKIMKLIRDCETPPAGIRVRITEGYAYKVMVINPYERRHGGREQLISEFIEYGVNTAERLMEVNPEITCLVTEGVGKTLSSCRSFFRMRKLGIPSCYPKSVNREDDETLEILRF